ncbi:hypothetical protein BDM02DRAFT_3124375, partial [Thelephora ganbajun]
EARVSGATASIALLQTLNKPAPPFFAAENLALTVPYVGCAAFGFLLASGVMGAEVFYGKNMSVVTSGPPHIGKAAGGKWAFHIAGCCQSQSSRYDVRGWEESVDAAGLSQCSEAMVAKF